MKFLPIHTIRVHEGVDLDHVVEVKAMITNAGVFTDPIIVDKKTRIVLDGHHRLQSCKELGATHIPCMLVDYLGDETITVHPRRKTIPVSKEKVVAMGLSDQTYPVKTTKHVIKQREVGLSISFAQMGIPSPKSTSAGVPFWKDTKDGNHGSVAIVYAGGDDVVLDEQFVQYECQVNTAWVLMLCKQKLIPETVGKSLLEGLQAIKAQHAKGLYTLNPLLEDVHSNVEQTLIAKYGIEVGGYMRLGIARNDQVYTDTRMWMRDHLLVVCNMLVALIEAIAEWSTHQTHTVMPGYTHVRVSQPITAAHWMTAKAFHILDDLNELLDGYDSLNTCPLGIAEMAGTHLSIDRTYTAQLLGFTAPTPHSLYTANQRGEIEAKMLFSLSSLAMHIRRTMNELVLFTGNEFGLFELGHAYVTGGTAQPNLVNPDAIEVVRAKMAKIPALALETVMVMDTLPSGYNRDTQATKKTLFDGFAIMEQTLPVVTGVLSTLVPQIKRMEALADVNFATAPDMTIQLSVFGGVSFREAYNVVKAIIKSGEIASFTQLAPQLVHKVALEVLKKPILVTQEQIDEVATARKAVMARTSLGGPAPKQVKKMTKKIKKEVRMLKGKLQTKKQRLADAHVMRDTAVQKILHPSNKKVKGL